MFKLNWLKWLFFVSCFTLGAVYTVATPVYADYLLQMGSKGRAVVEVQEYLYRLKYLKLAPDGQYGRLTTAAVKSFQLEHALDPDGNVGPKTLAILKQSVAGKSQVVEYTVTPNETLITIAEAYHTSVALIMAKNKLTSNQVSEGAKLIIPTGNPSIQLASRGRMGGIQVISWSIVNQLWNNGETATIVDVETGKSFQARRLYGSYHADVEPLTRQDTNTMHEIYGWKWSWSRRAVVVQLRNLTIAASINGMPHGHKSIAGNGFPGQFCTHFLGSRVHQNGQVDPDHLARIEEAANTDLNELRYKEMQNYSETITTSSMEPSKFK